MDIRWSMLHVHGYIDMDMMGHDNATQNVRKIIYRTTIRQHNFTIVSAVVRRNFTMVSLHFIF